MPEYLDIASWNRRDLFEHFRHYDDPWFNICADVDVTPLLAFARDRALSPFLAYHYLSTRTMNEIEPFRYRLRGERVLIHERINASAIVLRPDDSFAFVYLDYTPDFSAFYRDAAAVVDRARAHAPVFDPRGPGDDVVYHSVIPWVSFSSVSNARDSRQTTGIPKVTFGKFREAGGRTSMPVSVQVHHALLDGLHVGRFFERLQGYCHNPVGVL